MTKKHMSKTTTTSTWAIIKVQYTIQTIFFNQIYALTLTGLFRSAMHTCHSERELIINGLNIDSVITTKQGFVQFIKFTSANELN